MVAEMAPAFTRLVDKFDKRLLWSTLRPIGNSTSARVAIAMPVAGYLILLNEEVLRLADVAPRFRLLVSASPWRLVCVYYGSFLVGVASLIYGLRCPTQIRKYDSAVEYRNAEVDFFTPRNHQHYLLSMISAVARGLTARQREETGLAEMPKWSPSQPLSVGDLTLVLTTHWHVLDFSRIVSRMCAAVLFVGGAVLLAVPALATFAGVSAYLARSCFG